MSPIVTVKSIVNATIDTSARSIGEDAGVITLLVRFLVLNHPDRGTILVDTGYSERLSGKTSLKKMLYRLGVKRSKRVATPADALNHLGLSMSDVKDCIVTHIHADHIGNLNLLPKSTCIHAAQEALDMVKDYHEKGVRRSLLTGDFPELFDPSLLNRCQPIQGAKPFVVQMPSFSFQGHDLFEDGSVIATPLPGHAKGHIGIYIPNAAHTGSGFFYGSDTAFTFTGLGNTELSLSEKMISHDQLMAQESKRLVQFIRRAGCDVMLCHDDVDHKVDLDIKKIL